MSKLRRYKDFGTIYFITTVTYQRQGFLIEHADLLWNASNTTKDRCPFELIAWVIMPDHFHFLIDAGSSDISSITQRIKMSFAASYRRNQGLKSGRVWQHRFWDHVIRDQDDLNRHVDYIHFNPVKHGHVQSPFEWEQSSIHRHRTDGAYESDWGMKEQIVIDGDFGE